MSWIKVIPYEESSGQLRSIYDRIKGPDGQIDNVLSIHSLRPHTLKGHMSLYKNTLHHSGNKLPNWLIELLGSYTSWLNNCDYCFKHHITGMRRFLDDTDHSDALESGIINNSLDDHLSLPEMGLVRYTKLLTLNAGDIQQHHIQELRRFGYTDGEILEANQVVSYFNYANRTVMGLGVDTQGEVLGLSPKNKADESDWDHS